MTITTLDSGEDDNDERVREAVDESGMEVGTEGLYFHDEWVVQEVQHWDQQTG